MILVSTSHPLGQVLQNLDISGWLTKWAIELGEFDIKFMPKTTFKRKTLTNFLAEFMYPNTMLGGAVDTPSTSVERKKDDEPTDLSNVWSLRIDGSSNVNESGTSVMLESLIGEKISYALRLEFLASNNKVEYKALLVVLQLAKEMRVEQLRIYSDS